MTPIDDQFPPERAHEIARHHAVEHARQVVPPRPPLPRRLFRNPLAWVVLAVLLLGMISGKALFDAHSAKVSKASEAQTAQKLYDQLQQLGATPVATPSAVPGSQGPRGDTGPGPSASEIEAAVTSYCLRVECGKPPTSEQVLSAVREACESGTDCRGSAGQNGKSAPAPTQQQLVEAVAEFCSTGSQCQGPVGPAGPVGPTGATGAPGPAGQNGADGQPPVSWTVVSGPVTYQCVRAKDFDPSAPKYTCNVLSIATPTPTTTEG